MWTPKISELLIVVYLLDLQDKHPNIYELNHLLKRNKHHYSATFKAVQKLTDLDILKLEENPEDNRKPQRIYINKNITWIYGDDEFREAMLDDWDLAKEYIQKKLTGLKTEKEKFIKRLRRKNVC